MSNLQYYSYPGVGTKNRELYSYSQAVRVGDIIHCSGQGETPAQWRHLQVPILISSPVSLGGWNPENENQTFPTEINQQIDQAFRTVDHNIKHAGGKGWSQVFRVNSYHLPLNNEALAAMVRNFREWMPDHQPIWTCVGVSRLGEDDMRVEIEVQVYDPEGAKK